MRTFFTADTGQNNHLYRELNLPRVGAVKDDNLFKRPPGVSAKRVAGRALQFEAEHCDSAGLLLLDSSLKPIYASEEAVSVLCYPRSVHRDGHLGSFLVKRIDQLFPEQNGSSRSSSSSEFVSGKRTYRVRIFALNPHLENGAGPALAVLLERNGGAPIDVKLAARQFRLTQRETEAFELLTRGCKTREIAKQMDISPNTAKAFLRSIMIKTGACDRSAILAKVLHFKEGTGP